MTRFRAPLATAAAIAIIGVAPQAAAQFCPSYTASSPNNNNGCAIEAFPGANPSDAEWQDIFDLVAQGPAAWGSAGPSVDDIGQGCGKPEPYTLVAAYFPCELLKAIAMTESSWQQFCVPTTPADQAGGASRTIISFDCGYGIAQVTSGMHVGETPSFDRDRVASDPTYNLATGTRILASKWKATECVGDNQPSIIEHWYSATWAYNGLATINNPNHPNYDPARGVYDPQIGGAAPYQEKVFGRIEHTQGRWDPTPLAYPDPGAIPLAGSPPELADPACASPTDCGATRPLHATVCSGDAGGQGGAGAGGGSNAAGGSGGAGGGDSGEPPPRGERSEAGCGCRSTPPTSRFHGAFLLIVGLLLGRRRRREE